MAPFEALYATIKVYQHDIKSVRGEVPWPGWPSNAAAEATIMTTPRSPSSPTGVVLAMWGRHWRIRSTVPRTLTFITKSKSSRLKGFPWRSRIYKQNIHQNPYSTSYKVERDNTWTQNRLLLLSDYAALQFSLSSQPVRLQLGATFQNTAKV